MESEYKIIGGDGSEYGPATLEELKSWIGEGRVAKATQVWRNDTSAWLPAEQYIELRPELTELHDIAARAQVGQLVSAGFWTRLAAYIVDQFIVSIFVAAIWSLMPEAQQWKVVLPAHINFSSETEIRALLEQFENFSYHLAFVYYPVFMIYDVWLNGRFGATFGKMVVRARIIRMNGTRIGYATALLRCLAGCLERLHPLFFVGYLIAPFHPQKRALHDLLAGTRVVFVK